MIKMTNNTTPWRWNGHEGGITADIRDNDHKLLTYYGAEKRPLTDIRLPLPPFDTVEEAEWYLRDLAGKFQAFTKDECSVRLLIHVKVRDAGNCGGTWAGIASLYADGRFVYHG